MPDGLDTIEIGLGDWDLAKNYPAEIAVRADVRETLAALTPLLAKVGGAGLAEAARRRMAEIAPRNWTSKRKELVAAIEKRPPARPIDPDALMLRLVEALPRDAVIVHEGFTSTHHLQDLYPIRDRNAFHNGGSGGIGWSIPASVGVAFADPKRPVVTVVGDGSAMFSIQALWTIAHHKLPITTVICNNGGYRIIKRRLKSFHKSERYVGMDFADPSLDFTGMAVSLGMPARRITDTAEIGPALAEATRSGKPSLIEVMVDNRV